jgi:hypothetical protein
MGSHITGDLLALDHSSCRSTHARYDHALLAQNKLWCEDMLDSGAQYVRDRISNGMSNVTSAAWLKTSVTLDALVV